VRERDDQQDADEFRHGRHHLTSYPSCRGCRILRWRDRDCLRPSS
jgi:hypothetical protein